MLISKFESQDWELLSYCLLWDFSLLLSGGDTSQSHTTTWRTNPLKQATPPLSSPANRITVLLSRENIPPGLGRGERQTEGGHTGRHLPQPRGQPPLRGQ